MSGRGRPRKARSPDSKPKDLKPVKSKACKKEEQNGSTRRPKKQDQKMPNHAEEKPSVQTRKGKTSPFREENYEQLGVPTEITKAQTCSARGKLKEKPSVDTPNTHLKVQPGTSKTATDKTANGKKKLPVHLKDAPKPEREAESTTKPKKAAVKTPKVPKRADEAPQKKTEAQPERTKDSPMTRTKGKEDLVLKKTLENLKIKREDRSDACQVINDFITKLIKYLKENSVCFKDVEKPLHTGSYYENLKISDPDEFDVMLPIPVDRVDIKPFGSDGVFYSVELKRGQNPLKKFQQEDILSGCKMLEEFREEVKTFAKHLPEWTMSRKKKGCPAVTLTTKVKSVTISLDVVPCLKVNTSWPSFTKDGFKIETWLGTKVKQQHKREPYYLVPKYEGKGTAESDGVRNKDVWRISFSHVEKDIIRNHGSEKTCCEKAGASCCRKSCLKLLKYLLHLLKERDSSLDKFCSYYAKTTLLHACCSRTKDSQWRDSDLSECFKLLLQDFEGHLRNRELNNFFIPSQNLLCGLEMRLCQNLADSIKEQYEKGFPVFEEDLGKH